MPTSHTTFACLTSKITRLKTALSNFPRVIILHKQDQDLNTAERTAIEILLKFWRAQNQSAKKSATQTCFLLKYICTEKFW